MITVRLKGGLGNQMFQYALGRHLAIRNKSPLQLDLTYLQDRTPRKNFTFRDYDLDIFALKVATIVTSDQLPLAVRLNHNRIAQRLGLDRLMGEFSHRKINVVCDSRALEFDPRVLNLRGDLYLDGYWQTPKYFEQITEIIRQEFVVRPELTKPSSKLAGLIKNSQSVCVDVRRGDFVTNPEAAKFHGSMGIEYYQFAEKIISERVDRPHFFVTSDDINWCRENLRFAHPTSFLGDDDIDPKFSNKFCLMSQCRHYIIPNSTFAWWAAWLSNHAEKVVVAPKMWLKAAEMKTGDLIPSTWIRI